ELEAPELFGDRFEQVLERHRARVERALRFAEGLAERLGLGAELFELGLALAELGLDGFVARARLAEGVLRGAHLVERERERLFVTRHLAGGLAPRARGFVTLLDEAALAIGELAGAPLEARDGAARSGELLADARETDFRFRHERASRFDLLAVRRA